MNAHLSDNHDRPVLPGSARVDGTKRLTIPAMMMLTMLLAACAPGPHERELRSLWQQHDRQRPSDRQASPWLEQRRLPPETEAQGQSANTEGNTSDELPKEATFNDLVRYAMRHSPALEAAFLDWRAAIERIPQARSLPAPRLSFEGIIQQIDDDPEWIGERYALSQAFPWFGTLARRGDEAANEALAAERRFEAERLRLAYAVADAYAEYVYLERALAVKRQNVELLEELESAVRAMFEAGNIPHADVVRAELATEQLKDRLRTLADRAGPIAGRLNAALGRAARAPLPDPQPLPEPQMQEQEAQLLAQLAEQNPELAALDHESAARRDGVALARKDYYPDFTLGIEYARGADTRMGRMDGGGRDMLMGMLSLELPIWRQRLEAQQREALARFGRATHAVVDRRNELQADLRLAWYRYQDTTRRDQLFQQTLIPRAREAWESTEAAYGQGEVEFQATTQAQAALLELQLTHERIVTDRFRHLAEIHRLIGRTDFADHRLQAPAAKQADEQ